MNLIGLDDYLSTVGIVRKLLPIKNIKILPDETEKLITDVYRYKSFNDPKVKVDKRTTYIYLNFRNVSLMLTYHYLQMGNKEKAREIYNFIQEELPKWRFSEEQNEFLDNVERALEYK